MNTKRSACFLLIAAAAFAAHPKIAKDLDTAGAPDAMIDVIIQYKKAPTTKHADAVRAKGGQEKTRFTAVRAISFSVPAGKLDELADDPDVDYVTPDRPVRGLLDYAAPTVGATYAASHGWTGKGVGIAVIDSGVQITSDYASRVVYSESFVPKDKSPLDLYGHGTHVTGVAISDGGASDGKYLGMAQKAKVINLRVLDEHGQGQDSYAIAAIQRAIELKAKYNIRVINLSLGRPVVESFIKDPLCLAVEAAWNAGIVVVVAAGNDGRNNSMGTDGYGTISSPGNDPYVITVGAMKTMDTPSRADDMVASYSSKGPTAFDHVIKPDIVAPGNRVISDRGGKATTLAELYPANLVSRAYLRLSGTSVAAPMVAGAAALLLEKEPKLNPDQVKARLMRTASKTFPKYSITVDPVTNAVFTSQYDVFTIGAGYLDIVAALTFDRNSPPELRALSPIAVMNTSTEQLLAVSTTAEMCATSTVWGTSAVWGATCSTSAVWGAADLWGTSTVWGSSAVWGVSAVWGAGVGEVAGGAPPPAGTAIISATPVITANVTAPDLIWGESAILSSRSVVGAAATRTLIDGEK